MPSPTAEPIDVTAVSARWRLHGNATVARDACLLSGIGSDRIRACAAWNDEAAATAYSQGEPKLAARLWHQAGKLHALSAELKVSELARFAGRAA